MEQFLIREGTVESPKIQRKQSRLTKTVEEEPIVAESTSPEREGLKIELDSIFKRSQQDKPNPQVQMLQRQKSLDKLQRSLSRGADAKPLYSRFNAYRISPSLQTVYDDLKLPQPITKRLTLKQSHSQAHLQRHNAAKPPDDLPASLQIDTANAPRFYLKFASYLIDQEQRKIIDEYKKMAK